MFKQLIKNSLGFLFSTCLVLSCGSAMAQEGTADADKWRSSLTIYGWLPGVSGTLNYPANGGGGGGDSIGIDASDILDALDFAFMGTFEVRKNQWSVVSDLIYLDLSDGKSTSIALPNSTLTAATDLELKGLQFGLYGGYSVYRTERANMDVLFGLRYFGIDTEAEFRISGPLPPELPGRKVSRSADLWDGIVGVRGRANLNQKWFVPYHFDIGAGSSNLTWQALAGVGYGFGWGDLTLAYRYLYYDTGSSGLLQDFSFSGPALAVKFNF